MKSPICIACGMNFASRYFDSGRGGDFVLFANHRPESAAPDSRTYVGGVIGGEWFCLRHVDAARELRHLDSDTAVRMICERFKLEAVAPDWAEPAGELPKPTLWLVHVGDRAGAVSSIVRAITAWTPKEALARLASPPFQLCRGDAQELRAWAREFQDAGALTEIRYNDGLDGEAG